MKVAGGVWPFDTLPPGAGNAKRRCIPRTLTAGRTGFGNQVRLRDARSTVISRGGRLNTLKRFAARFCVTGGGELVASLDNRRKARFIASTARGHRARGVGRGASFARLRKAFPRSKRLSRGIYVARRGGSIRSGVTVFGVRGRRVTFVGLGDASVRRNNRLLRLHLKRTGFHR